MENTEHRDQRRICWRGSLNLVIDGQEPIAATIADISEMGCGLRIDRAIPAGTEVELDGIGFYGNGIVRHCKPSGGTYQVGIELRT